MKKLTVLLTILGLGALVASAQVPSYNPQSLALPVVVPATTSNLFTTASDPVISQVKQRWVALQNTTTCRATGATNVFYLAPSVDGVYYDTNNLIGFTNNVAATAGGTNTITAAWDSQGYGYYEFYTEVITASAGSVTNVATSWGVKLSSP